MEAERLLGKGRKPAKKKVVKLGRKGKFTIKHPGASRKAAEREGKSTRQWAEEHKLDKGVIGRRARSALGLMAMSHKG